MITNQSIVPNSGNSPAKELQNLGWREHRRAERKARHAARYGSRGGAWVVGAIFILLGIIFLLQNIGAAVPGNWWALFILLPAVGSFGAAGRAFSGEGQVAGSVIGSAIAGLFFSGLAFALFFDLNLTWIGPVLLIVLGIGVLAAALTRRGSSWL